jgi:hypothetical protein
MQIREYQESDLQSLCAIHAAQGFDYPLPDLRNPLFLTKLVLTDSATPVPGNTDLSVDTVCEPPANTQQGSERLLGAALLRLTAEAYLLLDPRAGTPHDRWRALQTLQAAAERDAWGRGLEDVHAWLPPPIAKRFGKRIATLGWQRDDTWTPYCKRLSHF